MSKKIYYKSYTNIKMLSLHFRAGYADDLFNLCIASGYSISYYSGDRNLICVYIGKNSWESFKSSAGILGYTDFVDKSTVKECYD